MADSSLPLVFAGVVLTGALGQAFAVPDWVVLVPAAALGALLTTGHKLFRPATSKRGFKAVAWDFFAGAATGVALAKLLAFLFGIDAAVISYIAFFTGHFGAAVSRALSEREGSIADFILGRLRQLLGGDKGPEQ